MEKLISTKHLELFLKEKDGKPCYIIVEKQTNQPIMECGEKGKLTHISNTIPLLIDDYKHYNELEELIKQAMLWEKLKGVAK